MKSNTPFHYLLNFLALLALALLPAAAHADSATWTGTAGDGNQWSNVNNWSGPPAAVPGAADIATFTNATSAGVVDLGASGVTVKEIDFNGATCPSYTLGAGAVNSQSLTVLNLNPAFGPIGGTANASATNFINATLYAGVSGIRIRTAGGPATWIINGDIAPAASLTGTATISLERNATINGLVKDGAGGASLLLGGSGTVTLANPNNSFTGGIFLNNGSTWSVNSIKTGANSCAGYSGTITMGDTFGGGTLKYTGPADTIDRPLAFGGDLNSYGGGGGGASLDASGTGTAKFTSDWLFNGVRGSKRLVLTGTGTGEMAGRLTNGNPATVVTTAAASAGATTFTVTATSKVPSPGDYLSAAGGGIPAGAYVTAYTAASGSVTISTPLIGSGVASGETITFAGTSQLAKTGTGTWITSGSNTFSGVTSISGGSLAVNSLNYVASGTWADHLTESSLGLPQDAYHGTIAINSATLTYLGSGETSDRVISLSGNSTLDMSGTALLKLTSPIAIAGTGARTLTLQGSTAGAGEISAAITNSSSNATSLTKQGSGTWTLSGANTYSGTTTISTGTLRVDASTGSLYGTAPYSALSFNTGTFLYDGTSASGAKSQNLGALLFSANGEGAVKTTKGGASSVTLTFSSFTGRNTPGGAGNFIVSDGVNGSNNKITFTTAPSVGVLLNRGLFFNGSSYAAYDVGGFVRAYGASDANYVSVSGGTTMGSRIPTDNVALTGNITGQTSTTVSTLNMGANSMSLDNSGPVIQTEGILSSGSSSAQIATGTTLGLLQTTNTGDEMVIRVDGSTDQLTISAQLANNGATACALTKSGAGTLVLSCASGNTYQGETRVSAGTLLVNSTITPTTVGTVRVRGGAILGGNGTIGGAIVVNANGIIQPSLSGATGNTLTFTNGTAPTFQTGSILKIRAPSATLDKVSSGSATLNIASMDLVVDTTGLSGNVASTTIVQLTGASPVITGPFRSVTVVGNPSYTATLDYSTAGQIKLALTGAAVASSNAYLTSLVLNPAGILSPAFTSNTMSYTATNAYGDKPTVTVVNADSTATNKLIYNGTTNRLASGVASSPLPLTLGSVNPVVVQVTAQDGVTVQTYTVNVTEQPSLTRPTLSQALSGAQLQFTWPPDHLGYTLQVKTNALNGGTWFPVPGTSMVTGTNLPIDKTVGSIFYRLVYP